MLTSVRAPHRLRTVYPFESLVQLGANRMLNTDQEISQE
jgi:hypothetical protein